MKDITLKIFIIVLVAGIIGVLGVAVLTKDIIILSDGYRTITEEYYDNTRRTSDIRIRLYRHQALVANHVSATSEDKYAEYEREAEEAEQELRVMFAEFGKRMSGGEREQIFHVAYTAFFSYIDNADNAMLFSRQNSKQMASYYVAAVMDNCVRDVNSAFDDLDSYNIAEINEAKARMNHIINLSIIGVVISASTIVASVVFTSISCFRITSGLDNYKRGLEQDIEQKNAALREHSEKMLRIQNNTIMGMANLIESRDGDTGEHVKRTSAYVGMLARAAQQAGYHDDILTDYYIELLVKAAPLHDIGKISISDSILLKPGKLTSEEFEAMKLHAAEGGRIVRDVIGGIEEQEYVDIAADVAAYHHERWDGSGYNAGLSGEDIPLSARIMAIADVFDALISKRCYKESMSVDEAFGIIDSSAGSHFDPELARIFVGLRGDIEKYLSDEEQ